MGTLKRGGGGGVLLDVHFVFFKTKSWVLGVHGKIRRLIIGSVPV